ncbi:MAG: rhamnulokinase [Kiritimatiellia bacterium]|jgi:rhamnulokinase
MSTSSIHLAIDLGASSGRVIGGTFVDGKLSLEAVHRFDNGPTEIDGHLYWKFEQLWADIVEGLKLAGEKYGVENIRSIGVDTWGVDYALFDIDGKMLHAPYHYRDKRLDPMLEKVFARVPKEEVFRYTGVQFMQINTLYQLAEEYPRVSGVDKLLMIPDVLNYRLTGKMVCERTIASTSQFYNPATHEWASELLERLDIPASILPELVDPGTRLGELTPELVAATGLAGVSVYTVAGHDTASSVVAVPTEGESFAYLSSGTWSLLGAECAEPRLGANVLAENFTNEVGVEKTIRLLKNINGLWILQECRRAWNEAGEPIEFSEMVELAKAATPLVSIIDPDDVAFTGVCDMPAAIVGYCKAQGQAVPTDKGAFVRCVIDSLALKYRNILDRLERVLDGERLDVLHITGGGTQNKLLNQCVANAVNRKVVAGPVEATAAGNVIMQMIANGVLPDLAAGRALVRDSFEVDTYLPEQADAWEAAYQSFYS